MRTYLKTIREEKGLSQQQTAEKIGISQNYYSMIENGERQKKLDLPIVTKLAELFNVSIEWIAEQEKSVVL